MSIATESFRVERVPQRLRATFGGKVVLDTTEARLLFEPRRIPSFLFPRSALDEALLVESDSTRQDKLKGATRHWSVQAGDRVAADAVTAYPSAEQAELEGLVAVSWDAMDRWFEEDQEVFAHAKNPYHRVDAYPSSRRVEVVVDGITVADTRNAVFLYETDMKPRYYIPKVDVRMELLSKTEGKTSACPYKGLASYYSLDTGEKVHKMRVWEYAFPLPESARIAGMLAFYQEKFEVRVGGERV
jgi:uncharacterized protein (DUF427 family)